MGGGREGKGREGEREGGSSLRARSLASGIGGRSGGVGQGFLNVRALKKIQESFENSL